MQFLAKGSHIMKGKTISFCLSPPPNKKTTLQQITGVNEFDHLHEGMCERSRRNKVTM